MERSTVRILRTLLIILSLISCPPLLHASDDPMDAGRTATIDFLLEQAISRGLIAGGVVVVGNHDGILYRSARGGRFPTADSAPLTERTMFDIASLTKVFATAPAVMKLLETGAINLTDPLTRWFPEFEGSGREDITVLNLLTHTSGLDDSAISGGAPLNEVIRMAASEKQWRLPGNRFRYADTNFILLGELVRRVTGASLDRYCRDNLYGPLAMTDTMFLPPAERLPSIAPTLGSAREYLTGIVQDDVARRLGGVAGHAGLFSSAQDLARFARMLLRGGQLDGKRIFSERVVRQMTAPYFYSNGAVVRGLGWDMDSPYSAPRGDFFSETSFGHTGYSGSSVWIDPQRDLFVILLTNRLDYRDIRLFNQLRSDISTISVAVFSSRATTVPPNRAKVIELLKP
ncbi:beta-lactamase family protein [Oryzomonas sagensis]|uniref:Beta-lactamase family protein n=1 Tax=Oryzomonas sagensis TaxID=2603857 RepID=A0ABQ6TM07_9BACT|nr:beta-lactamase family protein [Oryzomonas sagensis]